MSNPHGIDISRYQPGAMPLTGYGFVMIRASSGQGGADTVAADHKRPARDAGVVRPRVRRRLPRALRGWGGRPGRGVTPGRHPARGGRPGADRGGPPGGPPRPPPQAPTSVEPPRPGRHLRLAVVVLAVGIR